MAFKPFMKIPNESKYRYDILCKDDREEFEARLHPGLTQPTGKSMNINDIPTAAKLRDRLLNLEKASKELNAHQDSAVDIRVSIAGAGQTNRMIILDDERCVIENGIEVTRANILNQLSQMGVSCETV
jgi:hypothetical protein